MVPTTSRGIRVDEQPDIDYEFISKAEFQREVNENAFFEWDYALSAYYGNRKERLQRAVDSTEIWFMHALARMSVRMKARLGERLHCVLLKPGRLEDLEARLLGRSYDESEMMSRRLHWTEELDHEPLLDQVLENADSTDSMLSLRTILAATGW